jgi:hypothetical protein
VHVGSMVDFSGFGRRFFYNSAVLRVSFVVQSVTVCVCVPCKHYAMCVSPGASADPFSHCLSFRRFCLLITGIKCRGPPFFLASNVSDGNPEGSDPG